MNETIEELENPSQPISQSWWYALSSFSIAMLVMIIAFWSTYVEIVDIWWRSQTFNHGFLVIPIAGYLIWPKRQELLRISPRPSPFVLVLVFGAALLWLVGYSVEIAVVQHFAVVSLIPILVWLCMGTQVVRTITFPLAYIFFAAPLGDFLVEPLQDVTAAISVWSLQLTGIPVYWEGRFLHIPSGSFEVAQACSGIRYLIASLALGTMYAYLTYASYWRRLIFIVLCFIVPVIANGIRAYGIIMLAHLSDYKLAIGVDHIIYGWVFFGIVIFAMLWLGSLFRDEPDETVTTEVNTVTTLPSLSPVPFATWATIAVALAVTAPAFAAWLDTQAQGPTITSIALPQGINGWQGPEVSSSTWHPAFAGALEARGVYHKGIQSVDVYLAYYASQSQGAELVAWNNVVYDSKLSKRMADGVDRVSLANANTDWSVLYMQTRSENEQRLIWYWFEINHRPTTNRIVAKLFEMQRRLTASDKGSAAVVLSSTFELTAQEAKQTITAFLTDMMPALRKTANQ